LNKGLFEYTCNNTTKVHVEWERFCLNKSAPNGEAIIFLPGVALDTDSTTVRQTALEFVKTSRLETYVVYTRVEDLRFLDTQRYQAMAIIELARELGLTNLTLVGNSQGANRVLHLQHLLKTDSTIRVNGLILTNPAGFFSQDPLSLIFRFFLDGLVLAPIELTVGQIGKKIKIRGIELQRAWQLLWDITSGFISELRMSGFNILKRMKREAKEASQEFKDISKIDVPMVIISGTKDLPFNPANFELSSNTNIDITKFIKGNRLATHGMHYFRIDQVAKVSWYSLCKLRESFFHQTISKTTLS